MRLVVLAAAAAVAAAQLTPIPARYDGWKIGNADAPILVEAFFDLMVRPVRSGAWHRFPGVPWRSARRTVAPTRCSPHSAPIPGQPTPP